MTELSNCPYCGREMKIVETQLPDFTIDHADNWQEVQNCPVFNNCVDSSFHELTIEKLAERWNLFCANWFDKEKPGLIPSSNQSNVYCPIAKTLCNDGTVFNSIKCAFTTDVGGCFINSVNEVLRFLTFEIPCNGKSIPVTTYVDGGSISTYEQNC